MRLQYITRGMSDPRGKPKVYFACHPEDFTETFPLISDDLLKHANCAVWYDAEQVGSSGTQKTNIANALISEADSEDYLKEMQLAVFAVTSKFLYEKNRAKDAELPIALKNHIPILPIMLENDLGYAFNNVCAEIQMVRKYDNDSTAIPYDDVLQTFLNSVLVSDELAEQVRSAFDAYVFLSYRKKDRKHAQRLMRLIHENKQYRDIAIWYDEFLVPGEGFNEAIIKAFQKSSIFAMAVTPHLEENGNYVMRVEYPMAQKRKKEDNSFSIVPVEMYEPEDRKDGKDWRIDQSHLKDRSDFDYKEITDLQDEHRRLEMDQSFLDALMKAAKKENDGSAAHRFFIGLAYLNGIDVEINRELALKLIISAADDESPCMEATAYLADMYLNGDGVARNTTEATKWQKKLVAQYKTAYSKNHNPNEHKGYGTAYFFALQKLSDIQRDNGDIEAATSTAIQALSFCGELEWEVGIREQERDKALILDRLGKLYQENGVFDAALNCFSEACKLYEKQSREICTQRARRDLSVVYERLGDLYRKKDDLSRADMYYHQTKDIRARLVVEEEEVRGSISVGTRKDYSAVLTKLGNIQKSHKQYDRARAYYSEALHIDRILADEIKSPQASDNYGVSLVKIGDIAKAEGKLKEAEAQYREAVDIFRKNVDKTGSLNFQDHLAGGCEKLASIMKKHGEMQEAEKLYKEAISLRQKLYEKGNTVFSAHALATACYNAGAFLKDKQLMQNAYDIWNALCEKYPEYTKDRDRAAKFCR